jgi:hypothetical protein
VSLIDAFWDDSTPIVRRLLLDEAGGRTTGCVEFNFDLFDVVLDFDARIATVTDVLARDDSALMDLAAFLSRAASFGGDPSIGDGLTKMQRRPPRFRVDARGGIERLDDASSSTSAGFWTCDVLATPARSGHPEPVSNRRLQRPSQRLATVRASLRRWAAWLDELEAHPLDF